MHPFSLGGISALRGCHTLWGCNLKWKSLMANKPLIKLSGNSLAPKPQIKSEGIPSSEKKDDYLGKVQGITASAGISDGSCLTCQMDWRSIRNRSSLVKPWGIGEIWSQRLRSSATTFCAPGMWLTSISIPVEPDNKQSFSKNTQRGYDMLQRRLLPLSAPVLSLNVFTHSGKRCAGKTLVAMKRRAICANASKQVICRWRSCDTCRPRFIKSKTPNCSENHICIPLCLRKPPIWQVDPAAHASAAHSPSQ